MAILAVALMICSCGKEQRRSDGIHNLFILYGCGHVNLSSSIQNNINELCEGSYVPSYNSSDVLLAFCHCSKGDYEWSPVTDSYLIDIYKDKNAQVVRDTIWTKTAQTISSPEVVTEAMLFVKEKYKARHYSMAISGHGTGWLPQGTYDSEQKSDEEYTLFSIGQEAVGVPSDYECFYLDVPDFARALPVHLDILVLDLCLMGDIESIYELKDNADYIVASPTQVGIKGYDYEKIAFSTLRQPSPVTIGQDFMNRWSSPQFATVVVNTEHLEELAQTVKPLIEKYRENIEALPEKKVVQSYNADLYRYYYDLVDIFIQAGISNEDLAQLRGAVNACVMYKGIPKTMIGGLKNVECNGLSMSMPQCINSKLIPYYKTLEWNKATELVK